MHSELVLPHKHERHFRVEKCQKVTRIRGVEPRAAAAESHVRGSNVSRYTISDMKESYRRSSRGTNLQKIDNAIQIDNHRRYRFCANALAPVVT